MPVDGIGHAELMTVPRRRRTWIWALAGLAGVLVATTLMLIAAVPLTSDALRHRMIRTLSDRLDADVAIGDLHWRVFPRLHAEGTALTVRKRGVTAYPPLISVRSFSVDGYLLGVWRKHVTRVTLEGLDIQVPPDTDDNDSRASQGSPGSSSSEGRADARAYDGVVIDTLDANEAQLVVIPRKASKAPRVWAIHTLRMHNVGMNAAMPFEATLKNAVPPGEIDTTGNFGPWRSDDPGATALQGAFTFARADLSVFKGISGILSAHGTFGGMLERIVVDGATKTPDFTISVGGHPFPLDTKYRAIVDGTNGDTYLERIDASFLNSSLVAKGAVVDASNGAHGRTVSLDIDMQKGRIEDIMRMAVPTPKPPMTGALKVVTKFLLPPGDSDVPHRLQLDGAFSILAAQFTNYDVQGKIISLSHLSRARGPETPKQNVASNFTGRFKLGGGQLALPDLMFGVPGARVELAGHYALQRETFDFRGRLLMDAKISQTTRGFKSLLLKVVDPLFKRKGGGSSVPIKITGTRDKPEFGLDVGRVFKRGN
jgi:hypothetical protein